MKAPLTDNEVEAIMTELGITTAGKILVRSIRASEPVRRVNSGAGMTTHMASPKMRRTIQTESRTVEWAAGTDYESRKTVREFYDQPCRLEVPYAVPGSSATVLRHVPDFFVIRQTDQPDGTTSWDMGFDEWKTADHAAKLVKQEPGRWVQLPGGAYTQAPVAEHLAAMGLSYAVRLDTELPGNLIRNQSFLGDYRSHAQDLDPLVVQRIRQAVRAQEGCSIAELLAYLDDVPVDAVFQLIASEDLWANLGTELLTRHDRVHLYSSPQLASVMSGPAIVAERGEVVLRVGGRVRWGEVPYEIQAIANGKVFLTPDDPTGRATSLKQADFDEFVANGDIVGQVDCRPSVASALRDAGPYAAQAIQRLDRVERLVATGGACATRTEARWLKGYRDAEVQIGSGVVGLAPRHLDKGNRTDRFDDRAETLAERIVREQYMNAKQLSKSKVWGFYVAAAKEELEPLGVRPMGRTTFFERLRGAKAAAIARARWGRKAGFAAELRARRTSELPIHGDRVMERVHVDHTVLDIVLVDSATGEPIGRPNLTLAVDAYSGRILVALLLFSPPSSKTLLLVLRELVRTYGRLPEILVTDNGKEFKGTYFQTVAASYGVQLQYRQSGNAREGGPVESGFKKICSDLIWNLDGNTQVRKNVRKMSPSHEPSKTAVWTLAALHAEIQTYIANHTKRPNLERGGSPEEIWEQSERTAGTRPGRTIVFDTAFRALTAFVPTRSGGRCTITADGIRIVNLTYWSDAFRRPGVQGTRVPVRYEPLDARTAYALVNRQWEVCTASYRELEGRTETEIAAASEELRMRLGTNYEPTMLAIAQQLLQAQAREKELLLAREAAGTELRRSAEQRQLVAQIDPPAAPAASAPTEATSPFEFGAITFERGEGYEFEDNEDDEDDLEVEEPAPAEVSL